MSKAENIYDIDLEEGTMEDESFADHKDRIEDLEEIVERHANAMARYGLDFADNHIVVVDRALAVSGSARKPSNASKRGVVTKRQKPGAERRRGRGGKEGSAPSPTCSSNG